MNYLMNDLPIYVLGGSVITVTVLLLAVHRGLKGAGWPDRDRRMAATALAILLIGWFFAALIPAWLDFYRGAAARIPTVQIGLTTPLVAGIVMFWRWRLLRRMVEAVPQGWLAGIQLFRVLGVIFLLLYGIGRLPGEFALPAGIGDVAVGLLAPAVALAYARRPRATAGWLRAWNLFGIIDLVVAVTTGFLTSPSPLQRLALDRPNELITAFPLVMIPVFLVPLSILLHLASLWKLRQAETARGVVHSGLAQSL
jgi:hypothetical protein